VPSLGLGFQPVNVFHQFGFQIGGFVFMDDVPFGQFINHGDNFRQVFFGHFGITRVPQFFNVGSRNLAIKPVV
jgi:hypothetical protein